MPEAYEKRPLQSKKYAAYLLADLSWTLMFGFAIGGLYGLVRMEVLDSAQLVSTIGELVNVLLAMVASKLIIQGTYIGGQAWVDQAVRVAAIAKGQTVSFNDLSSSGSDKETPPPAPAV